MGWRERDWAKFSDAEWRRIVGPPVVTATPPRTQPTTVARSPRATGVTLLAALVTLFATTIGLLLHFRMTIHLPRHRPAANVLDVHWRSSDLAPAAAPGEICLATPSAGRVCAAYVTGERPADALAAQLRARGIAVRAS